MCIFCYYIMIRNILSTAMAEQELDLIVSINIHYFYLFKKKGNLLVKMYKIIEILCMLISII